MLLPGGAQVSSSSGLLCQEGLTASLGTAAGIGLGSRRLLVTSSLLAPNAGVDRLNGRHVGGRSAVVVLACAD